jgi:putative zinc finger/helix-turn-helix YgiT family protein
MNPQYPDRVATGFDDVATTCPSCGHDAVETIQVEHKFPYGDGDQAVTLSAIVPLRRCRECGFEFLDSAAEERKHEAVCRHLGVMTPAEVRSIRNVAGKLSRGEFARVSRLGEATIGRWERGELIQNAANDQLLYLLTFPENLVRLRERVRGQKQLRETESPCGDSGVRLRVIKRTGTFVDEAARFRLNKSGVA